LFNKFVGVIIISMFIQLLFDSPILFIVQAVCLVLSLTVHEFAHAYAAHKLGDDTAKYLGRLSLSPAKHLDPLGTLLLLTLGFGWGKPVPFNPNNLKRPREGGAIISFAGPLSNLILSVFFAILHNLVGNSLGVISLFFYFMVYYNLLLAFFNLLPFHPLDGFKVVFGSLPRNLALQWMQMEQFGLLILIVLLVTRSTSIILSPLLDISMKILGVSI